MLPTLISSHEYVDRKNIVLFNSTLDIMKAFELNEKLKIDDTESEFKKEFSISKKDWLT